MSAITMVLFWLMMDHAEAAERPVVMVEPNWNKFFTYESLSVICSVGAENSNNLEYYWKIYGQKLQLNHKKLSLTQPSVSYSGEYRCGLEGGPESGPVRLDIIHKDWLILQAPPHVYEGDTLTLRCHDWKDTENTQTSFYTDNHFLSSGNSEHFSAVNINRSQTGKYKCRKRVGKYVGYETMVAETYIEVKELFSEPTVKLLQSGVMEGDIMTLKCDTALAPPRRNQKLQFAFSEDGQTLQGFSPSDTFQIQSAKLNDSGSYACEAKTESDTVKKKSKVFSFQIAELFRPPQMDVDPAGDIREDANVTMRCTTSFNNTKNLHYMFYKDFAMIQNASRNVYVIRQAEEKHAGRYKCSARTDNGKVSKNSSSVEVRVNTAVGKTLLKVASTEVAVGDEIVLSCEATKGSPPILYQFYHNKSVIWNTTVDQKGPAKVHIKVDSVNKAGNYSCESNNAYSVRKQVSNTTSVLVMDLSSDWQITTNVDAGGQTWWPLFVVALGCLLLLLALLAVYRGRISIFPRCHQHPQPESPLAKVKFRAGHSPPNDVPQNVLESAGNYINVLTVTPPASEDILYSQVQIHPRKVRTVTPPAAEDVLYSQVRIHPRQVLSVTPPAAEDILYSQVQIHPRQGSAEITKRADELSVEYSAIK